MLLLRIGGRTILTDPSWYRGYINSLIYVALNTVMSLTVALPEVWLFVLGGLFVVVTMALPKGLAGALQRVRAIDLWKTAHVQSGELNRTRKRRRPTKLLAKRGGKRDVGKAP